MRNKRSVLVAVVSTGLVSTGLGLAAPAPLAHAATSASATAVGSRPGATRIPFRINDELQASVDVGSGNLMVTSADRSAPSIGGMTSFGLTYESLAGASGSQITSGAAGAGWFMPMGQDTRLVAADDGSLLFLAPNGSEGKFIPPSAGALSYTAPAGFRESLVKNSDGTWTMTDLPSQAKLKFGTDGRLVSVTDRNGQATTFAYSGGSVSSATLPTGQVVTFTFSSGHLASMTRPANGSLSAGPATYAYNSNGRLASISRPGLPGGSASSTAYTYSSAGDLASITDPLGNVTKFVYDGSHRVTSVAQGKGTDLATTRFVYVSATQTLVASPTSNQSVAPASTYHTTYTLNSDQRVTAVTDALGHARSATYTPSFDVASASNGIGGTASATYGANAGPMTKATSAMGSSQSWTYGTGSNAFNPSSSSDPQGNSSTMTYSNTGNPASVTNGGGAKASVTYNADGTVATSTDPAGHVTTYTESTTGKYIAKITPPSGSGVGVTTLVGNPTMSLTNGAGQTTSYVYNDRYGLTSATTPTQSVAFTYDADGRVTSRTDKNQKVAYGYDDRGNTTSITTTPVSGGKAPAAATVSYTYDVGGNMTSRTVNGSKTTYAYDQDQELTSMTEPTGAVTRFAYNNAGQRTDTWWRTNATHSTWVAHTHNVFGTGGNLAQTYTSVNSSDATVNRMSDYSYCYSKYVAGKACPSTGSSSANTGLVQYMQNNKAGTLITLGYDKSNRLTSATNWAGHNYVYSYDAEGNRTKTTIDGKVTQSLTFNSDNEISSSGYAYDKAGRRTADTTGGKATWNDLGQTVAQTNGSASGTISYAGLGQDELITQSNGSTSYGYIYGRDNQAGIPSEEEVTASTTGTPTIINNDAFGQAIDFTEGTASQYVMYSGTGNMIGTIDSAGENTSTYHLDPYGALLSITSGGDGRAAQPKSGVAPKTAAGEGVKDVTAAASGGGESPWGNFGIQGIVSKYWKRGARWNDTYTGTWTSVDPLTVLNDPSRANPYAFVGDNPLNQMDPAGRNFCDFGTCTGYGAAVGTLVGGVGGALAGGLATGGIGAVPGFFLGGGEGAVAGTFVGAAAWGVGEAVDGISSLL